MHSSNFWVYRGRSWRLSNCHIQWQQKWIFLKMLDFQRIYFSKKPRKQATPFAQPNCGNKSFELDHQIPSRCPIRGFLTVITNFWRALSQKLYDFSGVINQVLKMFGFRRWGSLVLKIKGIFEWIMSASKHLHHDIPTRGHSHHCIPKGTCASWHTH